MSRSTRPRLAIVGAGRAARVLADGLAACGYAGIVVASRRPARAAALARRIPGIEASPSIERAVAGAAWVILAVPDREIAPTARLLSRRVADGWRRRVVLHLAGAAGIEPLAALVRKGAAAGVLHPLQVLGDPAVSRDVVPGSRARIEGAPRAVAAARRLAADLRLVPLRFRRAPRAADRGAYHAAASLAANDVVALVDFAAELLAGCGIPRGAALDAAAALAGGAIAHLRRKGIGGALTGPVARADAGTLASQMQALDRRAPLASRVHALLSGRILEIAASLGRLPPADAAGMRRLLRGGRRGRGTV